MATVKGGAIRRPDLYASTIAVLLKGWGATAPEPSPENFGGGQLELLSDRGAPAQMWKQHERFLRAIAQQWNWQPSIEAPDGRRLFWAEAVAAGLVRPR